MSLKETIILSNLNEKELLRSLSLNGKDLFNVRVFNASKLVKEMLLRNGIFFESELIDSFKQSAIIYELLNEINYFTSKTLSDAKNIASALNTIRNLCEGDEESVIEKALSDGEFIEKNKALLNLFKRYRKNLNENNLHDIYDEINYCINNNLKLDARYLCFKEEELSPLEEALLKTCSDNKYQEISILDFVQNNKLETNKITYDNAYGAINEIEYIISYIQKEKIKLDDVLIVLNNNSYIDELINYQSLYNIPFTSSFGYPISLSNALKVFEGLLRLENNYNSLEYLSKLFNSREFDSDKFFRQIGEKELSKKEKNELLKVVGLLRINVKDNRKVLDDYKTLFKEDFSFYKLVENFALEMEKGYSYLIGNYTVLRDDEFLKILDEKARLKICELIDEYLLNIKDINLADIYEEAKNLSVLKEYSKPGRICVSNLKDALAINRKHIFITGLSALNFPGSPKENYLLLDSDLKRFDKKYAQTSNKIINDKKKLLMDVINVANGFNSFIHLSYSGYNLTELKEDNPSSMLFEIYRNFNNDNVTIDDLNLEIGKQHHFFMSGLSRNTNLGNDYILGKDLNVLNTLVEENKKIEFKKELSPSSAEKFFECPYRFYLKYVLNLNEPERVDAFDIMPKNVAGTLVHECMEDYGNNPDWTLEEFLENANNKIENYLKTVNPIHREGIKTLISDYLTMAKEGYVSDPHNIVRSSEEKLGPYKHESGLIFGGRVDRIEKLENDKYIIVDYKTYEDFKNIDDDIDTCFQVVLYAYLLNKTKNVEVERCEYRYLRNPGVVKVEYNDKIVELMNKKINQIKEAFETGVFNFTDDPSKNCKFCPYIKMCGIDKKESEEE